MQFFEGPTLAIETSCDETSVAVVSGTSIESNLVSSQANLHARWGGVVPEAAARAHVSAIIPAVDGALTVANRSLADIRAIACTNRPGLVGALSVGVTACKAMSLALDIPMVGVHHLEGHLLSVWASGEPVLPHLCLLVSGGHTELILVEGLGQYELLGQTIDDAAGEAFDKTARLLGLGYPGGAAIEKAATGVAESRYRLPRGLSDPNLNFSFSGLKTAVLRLVELEGSRLVTEEAAFAVQESIASVLTDRAVAAAVETGAKGVTLVGGVAANRRLRQLLSEATHRERIAFIPAEFELCSDNAAMIGIAGNFRLSQGQKSDWNLNALPNAPLP